VTDKWLGNVAGVFDGRMLYEIIEVTKMGFSFVCLSYGIFCCVLCCWTALIVVALD